MRKPWATHELSELVEICSGGTPSKSNEGYWGGDIPWVSAKDLKRLRISTSIDRLTEAGAEAAGIFPKGTVLVLVRGMTLFRKVPIGLAERDLAFNQDIKGLRSRDMIDPEFLAWALCAQEPLLMRQVDNAGHGTGRLNTDALMSCPVPLPPLPLQRRIAKILRTWDEAIEKTDRLIAVKRAIRDQLCGENVSWSKWPLASIGSVVSAVSRPHPTPTVAYTAVGIRSHGKGTFQRLISRPEEIDMERVYAVGARDLIVNITFAWEGAIALAKPEDEGCFVSHRFPTYAIDEKRVNRSYLGYAVRSRRFVRELGIASPGGAGRNRVLNKSDFVEIKLPLPPKQKQDQIAAVLDAGGEEIGLLNRQRDALAKQKRGLMQKLLTGEWPVSAPTTKEAAE
jgi:type I restriction enzyme S subunit